MQRAIRHRTTRVLVTATWRSRRREAFVAEGGASERCRDERSPFEREPAKQTAETAKAKVRRRGNRRI